MYSGDWPAVGTRAQTGQERCPQREEVMAKVRDWLHTEESVKEANIIRIMKARFLMLEKGIANIGMEKTRKHLVVLVWDSRYCCELMVF